MLFPLIVTLVDDNPHASAKQAAMIKFIRVVHETTSLLWEQNDVAHMFMMGYSVCTTQTARYLWYIGQMVTHSIDLHLNRSR